MSNALPLAVVNNRTHEKTSSQNINFDILLLAAREGLIDLEDVANTMLSTAVGFGYNTGAYTQVQLDRKIRDENRRLPQIDEYAVPAEVMDYIFERQLDDLIGVSEVTAFQEIVFRLSVAGLTIKNIAANLGLSTSRTAAALRTARRKVRAAYEEGEYAGWYEVYLSEVNRTRKK
ncbi:MAG: hypothetical protein ABFD83_12310 [Armatimonadota bacterium]